jgi:TetR/AcrR family transcriptional repressor of lmrAB and yxaGH operons
VSQAPADGGGAKRNPREDMIQAAMTLFRARGYEGVGIADLVAASGAPRGSIYFHFPGGKEQIAVEAIRAATEMVAAAIEAGAASAPTLEVFLDMVFTEWAKVLVESDYEKGCGVGIITLEMASKSDALRAATEGTFARWQGIVAARAERDGLSPTDAARLAGATIGAVQGAIVVARAQRSPAPFADAAAGVQALARAMKGG